MNGEEVVNSEKDFRKRDDKLVFIFFCVLLIFIVKGCFIVDMQVKGLFGVDNISFWKILLDCNVGFEF